MKTKIQAAGRAAGGGVILRHCDSAKLALSIRSSNDVDAHFDQNLAAVSGRDFDFEYPSEAVPDAALDHSAQVERALSGKQIEDVQSRKFHRTVSGKAFPRFVDEQNIAVNIEPKDNLVT